MVGLPLEQLRGEDTLRYNLVFCTKHYFVLQLHYVYFPIEYEMLHSYVFIIKSTANLY